MIRRFRQAIANDGNERETDEIILDATVFNDFKKENSKITVAVSKLAL